MKIWKKKAENESRGQGVARAALDGASHKALLQEALKVLEQWGSSGRIGVWLEAAESAGSQNENIAGFHGMGWERGNHQTAQEWAHLSVEHPLPEGLGVRCETIGH